MSLLWDIILVTVGHFNRQAGTSRHPEFGPGLEQACILASCLHARVSSQVAKDWFENVLKA